MKTKAERHSTGRLSEGRNRGNRGFLRFIGSGPDQEDPVTPQHRRGGLKPGDSAESPHIID
ncbi:uncharacterized protein P884DRAFT_253733 [Thermothelomyces heterothallicus CBS 202.75]|uniref:uncharacterized protein n=1 Tax=Thermothelomyces heterothallicus CBS 202.75 TaxID=1149848 RepID=UPI003742093D